LTQQKEATLQLLPPEWRDLAESVALTEIHRLHCERDQLEKDDTERRYHDYDQAQAKVEQYRRGIADLETEIESIPPEVRRLPSEVEAEIQDTRNAQQAAARDEQKARDEWRRLESEQAQRAKLQREIQSLENEFRLAKTLAELLGRDRLQRHLVRRAERQIVNFANAVLDRLSSGTIYLRLAGTEDANTDDEALQLEAVTRVTGDHPISVAFLSGSQRFRVAVSLALGMGQFANQLHRPIESIIIDEGFGCLDRDGRQSMIQELHQLRGLLSCIILVSHQEEFASAFADGYRFELRDGATVVERVRR
jgi:DNA repair exonuclease SbcCD ATPase subunit